ncbi:MAG: putative sigma-54 modulation protein [Flavobacteriales bacterium]|jgi:putative sigma-54 modulation protein
MQIDISGHHVEVTDAIRKAVNSKFSKVASHYPNLSTLDATLTVEKASQKIEVSTQFLGGRVSVHASDSDLYAAIADAAKKLESALSHRKGSVKDFKHEKPDLSQKEQAETAADDFFAEEE